MSAAVGLRARLAGALRSRRFRTVVLLVGGYNAYQAASTYNTIYKPLSAHRHRPGETVLDLNLDTLDIVRQDSMRPFSTSEEIRFDRVINILHAAKDDPRVTGLVVRGLSGLGGVGLAELTELRDAIHSFSSSWGGKHTMLHLPSGVGLAMNGTVALYLASAFNSVHVQPATAVIAPGLSFGSYFLKKMLDKVGLRTTKVARKEYKSAADVFTEEKLTEPNRESLTALLDAIMGDLVTNISDGRKLTPEAVHAALDGAMYSVEDAHQLGLVDQPLHRDELPDAMREQLKAAAKRRAIDREAAAGEWRAAMRDLLRAWSAEEGPAELWESGTVDRNLGEFEFYVPMAISLTDPRHDATHCATQAEIRALKAHIRWLDTCPWETVSGAANADKTVYRGVPYISAVMATERKLCEVGIRALEQFPKVVESYRKTMPDEKVLDLDMDGSMAVVRWCRGVWKAKCLAARMVGTFADVEHDAKRNSTKTADGADGDAAIDAEMFEPRLFLVGYVEDFEKPVMPSDGKEEPQDGKKAGDVPIANVSDETAVTIKQHADKKSKQDSMRLQYMRLSDYGEVVARESRAYTDRGSPRVRFESAQPLPFLNGTLDSQDRSALLRLQTPGHRLPPWWFNIPRGNIVAVISVNGAITDEECDRTRAEIRRAEKDPHVKAIVLRIDSPGGSATASETISRAVEVAKKPIVASMGSVCASGGYYIAAPCDRIFAAPSTVTGSIGVILQSFNLEQLFENVGISSDSVDRGRFSKYFGPLAAVTEWSEDFRGKIDALIDYSYATFLGVVSRGRGLSMAETERVAKGRIWAGSDAVNIGLVDQSGGLRDAIEAAAELGHFAPDAEPRAVEFPTLGMQVQEAARRRGIIPANLDEEGDEAAGERRRRRWPWDVFRGEDELEDGGGAEGGDGAGNESGGGAQAGVFGRFGLPTGLCRAMVAGDRFLSAVQPALSEMSVHSVVGEMVAALRGHRGARSVMNEVEMGAATAGRPAAIASNVRLED